MRLCVLVKSGKVIKICKMRRVQRVHLIICLLAIEQQHYFFADDFLASVFAIPFLWSMD